MATHRPSVEWLHRAGRAGLCSDMSFRTALAAAHFMSWRDIGLFRKSARTDAALGAGGRAAFEAAYTDPDPWASANPAYRYQRRKYEVLLSLLPDRPFRAALDLGCGVGLMSRMLAARADTVLGLDVAQNAVDAATSAAAGMHGVRFDQADILDLPPSLDGQFDLLVLADTLYYLRPIDDQLLKRLAVRTARLLAPGGMCLLANHYFSGADADSRLSRRIHRAFAWSPAYTVLSEHRRPFYLVSVLRTGTDGLAVPAHR